MAVMVDKETKEAVPVTAFLNGDQLAKDLRRVNDAARGKWLSIAGMGLAVMKNYDSFQSPTHFKLSDLLKKFDKTFGATGKNYGSVHGESRLTDVEIRRRDRWNFLFIAGMWFQDLFNYDFRRTSFRMRRRKARSDLRRRQERGAVRHDAQTGSWMRRPSWRASRGIWTPWASPRTRARRSAAPAVRSGGELLERLAVVTPRPRVNLRLCPYVSHRPSSRVDPREPTRWPH